MELPKPTDQGIECPNCEDGTELEKKGEVRCCPKCGYEEPR